MEEPFARSTAPADSSIFARCNIQKYYWKVVRSLEGFLEKSTDEGKAGTCPCLGQFFQNPFVFNVNASSIFNKRGLADAVC